MLIASFLEVRGTYLSKIRSPLRKRKEGCLITLKKEGLNSRSSLVKQEEGTHNLCHNIINKKPEQKPFSVLAATLISFTIFISSSFCIVFNSLFLFCFI